MSLDAGAAVLDIQGNLSGLKTMLSGEGGALFANFSKHIGGLMAAALPVAVGVGLFKIGETFDEQFDKIRTATGKTGKSLDGLESSFKNVAKTTPADFGQIGDAISGVNVKLGLTGKPLEALSQQILNLSRITKTDLAGNVTVVTGLFNNWNVASKDQGMRLDELFRAGQKTGIGVNALAEDMSKGGSALRTLGFTYEQSAALIGTLSKNGLAASPIIMGFSKSIATMAKAGESFPDTFRRIVGSIQNAKDPVAATGDAIKLFGARSGPKLAELIRSGKFSVEELAKSIAGGKDTINSAAKDTEDFSEKWKMFSNRLLVDVQPVATAVFGAVGDAMDALGPVFDDITQAVTPVARAFARLSDAFQVGGIKTLEVAFSRLSTPMKIVTVSVVALGVALWVALAPVSFVVAAIVGIGYAVYYAYTHFKVFRDVIQAVATFITETVWPALKAFALGVATQFEHLVGWVRKHWAAIREAISHVVNFIVGWVKVGLAILVGLWRTFGGSIISVVKAAWGFVTEIVRAAIKIVSNLFSFFVDLINGEWGKAWNDLLGVLRGVWDAIFAVIRAAWNIVSAILGAGLNALGVIWDAAWSAIGAVLSGVWDGITGTIRAAIGGVIGLFNFVWGAVTSIWSSLWNGLSGIFSSVWDGVIGAVTGGINFLIGIINGAIRAINSIQVDIPNPFGDDIHFGVHIPQIPRLHQGGIYRAPNGIEGLALLRDQERVVTPEDDAQRGGQRGVTITGNTIYAWDAREAASALAREQSWAELTAAR